MAKVTLAEYDHRTILVLYDGLRHHYWNSDDWALDCLKEVIRRVEYRDAHTNEQKKVKTDKVEGAAAASPTPEHEPYLTPVETKEHTDCVSCNNHFETKGRSEVDSDA